MSSALELVAGLITESGETWWEQADDFQRADAEAICRAPDAGPRKHYLVRGRGMSKTTDVGAVALSLLLAEAPKRSRSYCYAVDLDRSAGVYDALSSFVVRTPGLAGALDLQSRSVTVKSTGASLSIEASDSASAWSKRPWLILADEFGSWPNVPNYKRLWTAIASSLPKRPDSRLVILSMAGSPLSTAHTVWKLAQSAPDWRASCIPGPCARGGAPKTSPAPGRCSPRPSFPGSSNASGSKSTRR